jgi:uncharacterized phiE125 gp8 family phage protein
MPITSWPYQEIAGYPPQPYGTGFGLSLITPPSILPVTPADLENHVKIDDPDTEAPLLAIYLAAAVKIAQEQYLRRQLITATWQLCLDRFPIQQVLELPRPPLQSLVSAVYLDSGGNQQTLDPSTFLVDTHSDPSRLVLKQNLYWPTCANQPGAVTIQFRAGYGDTAATVPADFILGILHLAAHFYRNREPVAEVTTSKVPITIEAFFGDKNQWL